MSSEKSNSTKTTSGSPVRARSFDDTILFDSTNDNNGTTKKEQSNKQDNVREERAHSVDTPCVGGNFGEGRQELSKSPDNVSEDFSVSLNESDDTNDHTTVTVDEEDADLKLAKDMALAIAQNPNMTPAELRDLMKAAAAAATGNSSPSTSGTNSTKRSKRRSAPKATSSFSNKSTSLVKSLGKTVKQSGTKVKDMLGVGKKSSSSQKEDSGGAGSGSSPRASFSAVSVSGGSPNLSSQPVATQLLSGMGMRLGEFLESTSGAFAATTTSGNREASTSMDYNDGDNTYATAAAANIPIRMIGIVWKRRQGFGKYSSSAAWERRRIILKGTRLYYFKTKMDKEDDMSHDSGDDSGGDDDDAKIAKAVTSIASGWLETSLRNSSTHKHHRQSTSGGVAGARGYLDLVKENASVGASLGHSGSPTPFALSIKVSTQTKWKLCFDTQAELMQWLAAMTDVIVQSSVDSYNAQILSAHDPSTGADGTYYGQLSEPPLNIAHGSGAKNNLQANVGGHRLWVAGHYRIQSDDYPDEELEDVSEDELEEVLSDVDDDESQRQQGANGTAASNKKRDLLDPTEGLMILDGGTDVWSIPATSIWQWAALLNMAMILARSTSISAESFWYLITFTNIALFQFMKKEKVGGRVKPKEMSHKMARRLSSGLGFPISATPSILSPDKADKAKAFGDSMANLRVPDLSVGDYRPVAGTTTMRIEKTTDLPVNKDGVVFAGWRHAKPEMMLIRSHNYKSDKLKVPSPGDMYECVHVDIFESRNRIPDMSSRVILPKAEVPDSEKGLPKTWNCPDIFVVSIAIPTDPPKLYSSSEDGGGYTVTMYFRMRPETRAILRRITAEGYNPQNEEKHEDLNKSKVNAVRLLEEWCRRAPTDDAFAARFKVLPNAQNLKEIGLPTWIAKYNGKPFLIKRPGQTGFIYRHPEKSCIEFDISLHPFPYLAKQGICFMKDTYFKKVLVTFGFLIEGRSEDELPECLIGLMQLCYPDPMHAVQGEDFFAGTSQKSF